MTVMRLEVKGNLIPGGRGLLQTDLYLGNIPPSIGLRPVGTPSNREPSRENVKVSSHLPNSLEAYA